MAQWLVVGEHRFKLASFDDLTLDDLDTMEDQTGLTLDEVKEILSNNTGPMGSKRARKAFAAMVWMVRRVAGEELTVDEAVAGVPIGEFDIVDDDPQPEEELDPTSPNAQPDADPAG